MESYKRIYAVSVFLLCFFLYLCPQDIGGNYRIIRTWLNASGTESRQEADFHDGLGRPFQRAVSGMNTSGRFIHTFQEYDPKGRVCARWVPTVGSDSLVCLSYRDFKSASFSCHSDSVAVNRISYDIFDRETGCTTPGSEWSRNGKRKSTRYVSNRLNSVKRYEAPLGEVSLVQSGCYEPGSLYGEERTDEDGLSITVYRDKCGRIVLERRGENNDTYYVYNLLGQLRYVLSPQYQHSGYKADYAYEYRYDARGNCVKKILPGCEYIQYWYDKSDRLIYMQDACLRSAGLYRFYIHDRLGRRILEGTCSGCNRGETVNRGHSAGTEGFCGTGYTLDRPDYLDNPDIEVIHYYGSYEFLSLYEGAIPSVIADTLVRRNHTTAKSRLTGTIQYASNGGLIAEVYYYDTKGRPSEVRSYTLAGRYLETYMTYTYSGEEKLVRYRVMRPVGNTLTVEAGCNISRSFDSRSGILTGTSVMASNGTVRHTNRTSTLVYDDLGRVSTNVRGNSAGTVSFNYNLHGWLTSLAGPGYSEELFYTDGPGTPHYNGNISSRLWTTDGGNLYRGYKYSYDALNRLTRAEYGEHRDISDNPNRYTEAVLSYTENGVIERLQRHGLKDDGVYGKIDNLNISLDGNRIVEVTDDALPVNRTGAADFRDGANLSVEYAYNGNGALVSDANKGIACIEYDLRNHPRRIQFTNGNTISYVYSPLGKKLRTVHLTAVDNVVVPLGSVMELSTEQVIFADSTDYCENFVYENDQICHFLFTGGYAEMNRTGTPAFRYYTQDYQGNNRVVVDENGNILQTVHYYPFGGIYADAGTGQLVQPYKFGGKELDRMHGLDWYDFGARSYDAAGVPMFTSVDPLCEKSYHVSPYVYCENNPLVRIDKNGEAWETVWDLFNITLGIQSFTENIQGGNYWDAAVDAGGILIDAAAAIVPAVPGGVGTGIKAARGGNKTIRKILPNEGEGRPHGGEIHNKAIDDYIKRIRENGGQEIRKNQRQVDVDGHTVGRNRPDVQYNKDEIHHNVEFDTKESSSEFHKKVIEKNDPKSNNEFIILK